MSCKVCNQLIVGNEEKVMCKICKVNYVHATCAKVEPKGPGRRPKWICSDCKVEKSETNSEASEDEEKKGENKIMQMLAEMNKKLDKVDKIEQDTAGIKDLQHSVEHMSEQYDKVLKKLEEQDKSIKSMEKEINNLNVKLSKKDNEVEELNVRVQELEQARLAMNVEVHGLPTSAGENTFELVKKVGEVIGAPPATQAISDCYRVFANPNNVRKQGIPPILVVKFTSVEARRVWLDRNKTKNLTVGRVQGNDNTEKIFVCEHLTPDLKRLFFKTRTAGRIRNYKFVWVKDGKILAKKSEDQGTVRIRCDDDIDKRMPGVSL